ncbi:MAG: Smr/MutS family protein [Myxococcota bacterium]
MSRSKYRPFRDLKSRIATTAPSARPAAGPPAGFADAVGPVRPLDARPRRIDPPAPPATGLPADEPDFHVVHDGDHVHAWREGMQPLPEGNAPAPSSTLDLHGLDEERARRAVQRFVVSRGRRGDRDVLLIVGKGLRSPGGQGQLRLSVVNWLRRPPCAAYVVGFRTASRSRGGTGAMWVRLGSPP